MSKVRGIERFADAMSGCKGGYVLIGGGACSVLFDNEGDSFRATEDLDVVVIVDGKGVEFATALWAFIKAAGYETGKVGDGRCTYYRFCLPEGSRQVLDYPGQIELFARHPDFVLEDETSEVAPLSFDGAVSSLSAIILDDGYYEFIRDNATNVEGITLLDALHTFPSRCVHTLISIGAMKKGAIATIKIDESIARILFDLRVCCRLRLAWS